MWSARTIIDACNAVDTIYYFTDELKTEKLTQAFAGQTFEVNGYPFEIQNPSPSAIENMQLAFLILRIVFPKIPMSTLQAAFKNVKNPARMELVQAEPKVYLSGDHNLEGIHSLIETLKTLEIKPRIVCAFSPDKPFEAMFKQLESVSSQITLTSVTRLKDSLPSNYFKMGNYIEDRKSVV